MSQENLITTLESLAQSWLVTNFNSDELAKLLCHMYVADQQERKLWEQRWITVDIDQITYKLLQQIEPKLCDLELKTEYEVNIFGEKQTNELQTMIRLIVQHQDHNPVFQQHILGFLWQYFWAKEIAYLQDRIKVNIHQPQIYGTQWTTLFSNKRRVLQPVEWIIGISSQEQGIVFLTDREIELLNIKRVSNKMWTIEEYFDIWKKRWYEDCDRPLMIKDMKSVDNLYRKNWIKTIYLTWREKILDKVNQLTI